MSTAVTTAGPSTSATTTATLQQRRRGAWLAAIMLTLAAIGAASRIPFAGAPAAPCAKPALRDDGVLVCNGDGKNAGARSWLAGGKLDVNAATVSQLAEIHGVGPSLARAIVDERARRGGFQRFDELDDVVGIGPKTLAKLAPYVDVR